VAFHFLNFHFAIFESTPVPPWASELPSQHVPQPERAACFDREGRKDRVSVSYSTSEQDASLLWGLLIFTMFHAGIPCKSSDEKLKVKRGLSYFNF
jgi:hypothetical protein